MNEKVNHEEKMQLKSEEDLSGQDAMIIRQNQGRVSVNSRFRIFFWPG
jgi:hypothetical protein